MSRRRQVAVAGDACVDGSGLGQQLLVDERMACVAGQAAAGTPTPRLVRPVGDVAVAQVDALDPAAAAHPRADLDLRELYSQVKSL